MPKIINGEIVSDDDPRLKNPSSFNTSTTQNNQNFSPENIRQTLRTEVNVFGHTLTYQNLLIIFLLIVLFGGLQMGAMVAFGLYLATTYNNNPTNSSPNPGSTASTQYATTQGTQTFSNDDHKGSDKQSGIKKFGNIAKLDN
eukprot:TRINITY_DN6288_c3_g1_i1.p1 TRINITY_DN6288_c3_g1~~TRINITY_DN6288_c3_g1_i1.p1  ORF type:complete len:142 (-),score=22.08 TRINITY_DN6288_c3_g1_i1:172-597(-)